MSREVLPHATPKLGRSRTLTAHFTSHCLLLTTYRLLLTSYCFPLLTSLLPAHHYAQVKDALFGEWGRGVVELEQPKPQSTVPEFQGAAGGTSNFINYHAAPTLTVNCRNQYFDTMKAGEDAVSGSEGVYGMSGGYFDPKALTPQQQASMQAAARLTEGVAGISTFATVMNEEIAQRPDHRWRRGTPHQQEEMHS